MFNLWGPKAEVNTGGTPTTGLPLSNSGPMGFGTMGEEIALITGIVLVVVAIGLLFHMRKK